MNTDSSFAQSSCPHIPSTVSEKAAAILRGLINPKQLPSLPDADDVNAWTVTQAVMESYTIEQQKPLLDCKTEAAALQ